MNIVATCIGLGVIAISLSIANYWESEQELVRSSFKDRSKTIFNSTA